MKPFLSTVTNKVDTKGRVSVPAGFRTAAKDSEFNGVICFPSFNDKSIEGFTLEGFGAVNEMIDQLPPFSAQRDALAASILGRSHELSFDKEGRIKLPESFVEHSDMDGEAMFIGLGSKFKIWCPKIYGLEEDRFATLARESREGLGLGGGA
jgi:transcriptional regulator MraZ